jgi:serine/threonine-protein kinase
MPLDEPDSGYSSDLAEARIGEVIDGRYRIEGVLGVGGLGVVYRAEHQGLRRFVALKVMHEIFADHDELRKRFEREARALSALDHPNIVAITDFGAHAGAPYLAMQLIDGQSLSRRLADGPLPIDEAIEITRQILEALIAAHAHGVVHRDLKPGNVMIEKDADDRLRVRIVDFGLARIADPQTDVSPDATLTKLGTVIGSPSYMAPEQTTASKADGRADLYALGIILYEMLVGRPPFVHEDKLDTVRSHLTAEVPPPQSLRPGLQLTSQLDALLDKALAKVREDRFASAEEMKEALEALPRPAAAAPGESLPPAAASVAPRAPSIPPNATQPLLFVAGAALALLVVAGLAAGGIALVMGLSSDEEETVAGETEVEAEEEDGIMVVGEDELPPPGSRPPPSDPLAGGAPAELATHLALVTAGTPLTRPQQREVLDYQGAHQDDPRPSLILAHDYTNQHWYRDAISRYTLVHRIDPAARGNSFMLADLISMIGAPSHGEGAVRAIRRIYGAEALPDLRARLADARDPRERHQIERLIELLER